MEFDSILNLEADWEAVCCVCVLCMCVCFCARVRVCVCSCVFLLYLTTVDSLVSLWWTAKILPIRIAHGIFPRFLSFTCAILQEGRRDGEKQGRAQGKVLSLSLSHTRAHFKLSKIRAMLQMRLHRFYTRTPCCLHSAIAAQ